MIWMENLKKEFLELLDRDLEFRYAIAGYLGLSEILKRLDSIVGEQTKVWVEISKVWEEVKALREEQGKIWAEINKVWSEISRVWEEIKALREGQNRLWEEVKDLREGQNRLWEELTKLREDMIEGFRRHDEEIAKLRQDMIEGFRRHDEEIARLRLDMMNGFKRHDEILMMHAQEIVKLREDMVAGFKRHDEEIARLRQDMMEGFKRHDEELAKLRSDMIEGFNLLKRHLDALGARWGIMAEEAFREGLRGLIERELGFRVERWVSYDDEGMVFGYPSRVEVDIAVKDERLLLVEVSSHIRASDVHEFKRKAELYERKTGRKPDRLIIITPYADGKALETAEKFDIEVYTKV